MKKRNGGWFSHKPKKEVSQIMRELAVKKHANIRKNAEILRSIREEIKKDSECGVKLESIKNIIS